MVIFGASGDLTHRKLIPALFDLFQDGLLGKHFAVLGFSRSDADQRRVPSQRARGHRPVHDVRGARDAWQEFSTALHYMAGKFDDPASYEHCASG